MTDFGRVGEEGLDKWRSGVKSGVFIGDLGGLWGWRGAVWEAFTSTVSWDDSAKQQIHRRLYLLPALRALFEDASIVEEHPVAVGRAE